MRVTRVQDYRKGFLYFIDAVIHKGDTGAPDDRVTTWHDQLQWCGIKIKVGCGEGEELGKEGRGWGGEEGGRGGGRKEGEEGEEGGKKRREGEEG